MNETAQDFDLQALVSRLANRKWTILAVTIIIGAISTTSALLTTPVYQATSQVAVEPPSTANLTQRDNFQAFSEQEIETQRHLVISQQVAQRVKERLALPGAPEAIRQGVTVGLLEDTRVLIIAVVNSDPQRAADLAQAFAEEYLSFRQDDALERLLDSTAALEARLESTRARIDQLEAELEDQTDELEQESLARERDSLIDQLASIQAALGQTEAGPALISSGGVVLANATVPVEPIEPRPVRSAVIGTILGLMVAIGLALAQEHFDDRLRNEHALQHAAPQLSVLTRIPWHEEAAAGRLVTLEAPTSPATECYRSLRTQLRFVSGAASRQVVAFTSSLEAEGKTMVACNYAITSAQAGYRTLLIDGDLRQPRVHEMFGLPNSSGLSHVLTAQARATAVSHHGPNGLAIITSGPIPPNPSELLGSQQFVDLLDSLSDVYDVVIVDTAPILPVADGVEVSSVADATVVIVNAQHSRRRALLHCLDSLRRVEAKIAGLVHTQLDPRDSLYDSYYYRGPDPEVTETAAERPAVVTEPVEGSLWGSAGR